MRYPVLSNFCQNVFIFKQCINRCFDFLQKIKLICILICIALVKIPEPKISYIPWLCSKVFHHRRQMPLQLQLEQFPRWYSRPSCLSTRADTDVSTLNKHNFVFIPGLFCKVVFSSNLYLVCPQTYTCKYAYSLGFNKNIVNYRPQFCKFDVPSSSIMYIFLPLGTSNLRTWG